MTGLAGPFDGRLRCSPRLWICAAAIAVAATSCGAPSLVRDDIHRDEWYELRSQHIQLTTDVPLDRAQQYTRELEQSWRALTMMYAVIAPWATPPDAPFPVIHLNSCSDYADIGLKNSIGFVFLSRVYSGERFVVTCEQPNGNHSSFLHELTHILNRRCIPLAPPWVNEGLAMYFETMTMADGRVVVGNLPPRRQHLWRTPALLPKLPDLLGLDNAAFRDDENERYYFAAWKAVHLLNNTSQDYRNRFRGYLAMLNGDHVSKDAWESAFHGIPQERLAEEYGVYQQLPKLLLWTASYQPENPPEPTVRRLRPGEAHVVWAHLLSRMNLEEALRQIDLAARADRF